METEPVITDTQRRQLRLVSQVLGCCLLFSLILMLIWFVGLTLWGDMAFRLQSSLFEMTRRDFNLISYGFLGFVKIVVTFGFLIPYLAIRHVLKTP